MALGFHPSKRGGVLALMLTIVLSGLLVACGGSDDDEGAGGSSGGAPASSSGGSAPTSSNDAAPTPRGDSPGTASNANVDLDFFCPFLKDLFHGVRGSGGPSELPVDQLIEIFEGLSNQVPDAIHGEVVLLSEAYLPFLRLASELNIEDISEAGPEDRQRLETAAAALDTPEVRDATTKIDGFLVGACLGR